MPSLRLAAVLVLHVSVFLLMASRPAHAQLGEPPGPFVIDARAAFSSVPRSEDLALPRGLRATELPQRVIGLDVGGHVYPVRGRTTLGVGASLLRMGGTQTPDPLVPGAGPDAPITAGRFQLTAVVPQLSLNFGTSRGWSYVGAGAGLSRLQAGRAASELASSPALVTLHMGGGARWFVGEHVALSLDLRFYRVGARELSGDYIGSPSLSMFVAGAGLSFK
jgi:hypothetical protein